MHVHVCDGVATAAAQRNPRSDPHTLHPPPAGCTYYSEVTLTLNQEYVEISVPSPKTLKCYEAGKEVEFEVDVGVSTFPTALVSTVTITTDPDTYCELTATTDVDTAKGTSTQTFTCKGTFTDPKTDIKFTATSTGTGGRAAPIDAAGCTVYACAVYVLMSFLEVGGCCCVLQELLLLKTKLGFKRNRYTGPHALLQHH